MLALEYEVCLIAEPKLRKKSIFLENDCIIWKGARNVQGYGEMRIHKKLYRVHRLAYVLTYSDLTTNDFVCHRCDTRLCINPKHLFKGTATDNNRDRSNKGRSYQVTGPEHFNSLIKDLGTIEEIFGWAALDVSDRTIANYYGVSRRAIQTVLKMDFSEIRKHLLED